MAPVARIHLVHDQRSAVVYCPQKGTVPCQGTSAAHPGVPTGNDHGVQQETRGIQFQRVVCALLGSLALGLSPQSSPPFKDRVH